MTVVFADTAFYLAILNADFGPWDTNQPLLPYDEATRLKMSL